MSNRYDRAAYEQIFGYTMVPILALAVQYAGLKMAIDFHHHPDKDSRNVSANAQTLHVIEQINELTFPARQGQSAVLFSDTLKPQ